MNRVGYGTRAVGQFCFLLHPLEHNRVVPWGGAGRGLVLLSYVDSSQLAQLAEALVVIG